jgi:hypothetical protein
MREPTSAVAHVSSRRIPLAAVFILIAGVFACSIYANLSFAVTNSAHYRFFPPFHRHVNANCNRDLGAENGNIARSLVAGDGFANPFRTPSSPTAWMAPPFPAVLAALLWLCDGSNDAVMTVVIFLQLASLIATGLLILALVQQTTRRAGTALAVAVFGAELVGHFSWCFQMTQDWWLGLAALDLLVAGLCWCRPLASRRAAGWWGFFGGVCGLVNPVIGLAWGLMSLQVGLRERAGWRLALACVTAGGTLLPWTVRNYLVFGRLIPVKSNLAYELYQSQCLQPDGVVRRRTLRQHPYTAAMPEGQDYHALGESAFLERKQQQFRDAVASAPLAFLARVGDRFLAATLWYEPFDPPQEAARPWTLWFRRLTHPLPFLALLILVGTAARRPLGHAERVAIGVYALYLLPYVVVSYYPRYAVPLL